MVLTNLEDKDNNNIHFLQELRQVTTPTPEPTVEFAPLIIPSSSKPSESKFEKKRRKVVQCHIKLNMFFPQ